MIDQRNMILAVVLAVVILLGSNYYFDSIRPPPPPPDTTPATEAQGPGSPGTADSPPAPAAPTTGEAQIPAPAGSQLPTATGAASRTGVLAAQPRIKVLSSRLQGSISLVGGRFDDLTLARYQETLDPASPEIILMSPQGAKNPYFADFGWVGAAGVTVPDGTTLWTADSDTLTPEKPVTLSWDNGKGLRFTRTLGLDANYMFTVTQGVENTGTEPATLHPYALISRHGTPDVTGFVILHEGPLGVFDGQLKEVDYDDEDLQKKDGVRQSTTGGWIGITDKYWLTALVPDQSEEVNTRFIHFREGTLDKYQVDFLGRPLVVAPRASVQSANRFFAGAKEVKLLDGYETELGISRFDLAIDFGWFYFLTKPIFYALIYINDHIGNFGVSILLLTVLIKILFFPLANKSYRAMSKMKKLQPEMLKLRERFGEDKARLNQEMMALYKREKANPASGCLPMVIQIPVFFALYKVLFVTIEMRHAPFFGWIKDLSAQDPTSIVNLFGLLPFAPPDFIPDPANIGIWPLIMGITMFLQQKLNPQPPDPIQAKIFMFLPIFFTFILAQFPAGLVIYWAWNNLLSIIQQWVIMRRAGVTPGAGVKKT
jgi:YidC/Oxa1 family membrane protein insertase